MRTRTVLLALLWGTPALADPQPVPPPRTFEAHIDDPMLAPAPRAPREVHSWDEARSLLAERSTDLKSAMAGVERAEGKWRQSLSALLPNAKASAAVGYDLLNPDLPALGVVGGGAAAGTPGAKPSAPVGAVSAIVNQSVVDVGAWRGLSSAEAGQRSAEASLADARRRLTQGLARSLVAVVAAERAAELNRVSLRQALERSALTERLFQLGAGTQLDVVRVKQDVAVARGILIAGDVQLRRTREALGTALGFDTEVGVQPGFDLNGLPAQVRQECPAIKSVDERADVVAAKEQARSAEESRRQAKAGYFPTLGVTSGVVAVTTDPGLGRFATWNIGAVLSVPLWEGGLRKGLVGERHGIEEQAKQTAEATRRAAAIEAERADKDAESAEQLVVAAREARDLAQRQDDLTRKSFEIGRATSLDLVQSAAVLRQAELNLALREFEAVQAHLDAFLTVATCER